MILRSQVDAISDEDYVSYSICLQMFSYIIYIIIIFWKWLFLGINQNPI